MGNSGNQSEHVQNFITNSFLDAAGDHILSTRISKHVGVDCSCFKEDSAGKEKVLEVFLLLF